MRVALIQMKVAEKNRRLNIQNGFRLLRETVGKADVAVLPEVWTTGYSLGALYQEAESLDGQLIRELSSLAAGGRLTVVAGSVPLRRDDGRVYNTSLVFSREGELIAQYDKIHMFSLYNEQRFFSPGSRRVMFALDGLSCGLSVCYDLRFPELFRAMALNGAEAIFLPAEWPAARGEAWRILVQARALENQLYMCAVNCVGSFRENVFYGHSLLVGPDGGIIAEGSGGEEIIYAYVERETVSKARSGFNALRDVRGELYKP